MRIFGVCYFNKKKKKKEMLSDMYWWYQEMQMFCVCKNFYTS